jgi:hypothetical protein
MSFAASADLARTVHYNAGPAGLRLGRPFPLPRSAKSVTRDAFAAGMIEAGPAGRLSPAGP